MKVLLIYTNTNRYLSPPPIGLTYIVPPLIDSGHQVKVLDLMFSKDPKQDLDKIILEFSPGIAGFSIRNLDNQYMLKLKNNLPEIKEYISQVKNKGIPTVLGGTAFTTFPAEMLEYMKADYGIAGQGENSFLQLVNSVENKTQNDEIPGLVKRQQGKIIINTPIMDGYSGKTPDWSLIDVKQYKRKSILTPCAGVVIKTGCPYPCTFCNARESMGNKFIMRSYEEIINDIRSLKTDYNVRTFFFNAICFNSPIDYAKGLLKRIIDEKLRIRFLTRLYPIRGEYDDEFIKLYKKAGGYFAMVDFESFSDKMLQNYKKPFNLDDIYQFGKLCDKNSLKFGAELLFGGPGENEETIKESMAFLSKINYKFAEFAIGIRINPKTEMFDIAIKEGVIEASDNLLFSKFYVSKDLDIEWAKSYIHNSIRKYSYRQRKMLPILIKNLLNTL